MSSKRQRKKWGSQRALWVAAVYVPLEALGYSGVSFFQKLYRMSPRRGGLKVTVRRRHSVACRRLLRPRGGPSVVSGVEEWIAAGEVG